MTYTPPEQPAQGGYQPSEQGGYQPAQPGGYQPYETASTQYGAYAAAPASTSRKLSLWGLILGISGLIIPIFVNSIAGAVLSGIGLAKEPAGKTMAIWGLVLSVLGFIWGFIFWPIVLTVIALAVYSESGGY